MSEITMEPTNEPAKSIGEVAGRAFRILGDRTDIRIYVVGVSESDHGRSHWHTALILDSVRNEITLDTRMTDEKIKFATQGAAMTEIARSEFIYHAVASMLGWMQADLSSVSREIEMMVAASAGQGRNGSPDPENSAHTDK